MKKEWSEADIQLATYVISNTPTWTEKMIVDANRGMEIGGCNDPWPIELKMWFEFDSFDGNREELVSDYLDKIYNGTITILTDKPIDPNDLLVVQRYLTMWEEIPNLLLELINQVHCQNNE